MIPDFNDEGYLPPGIHAATLGEIAARFGREPEIRHAQAESLGWLFDLAKRVGVRRFIVDAVVGEELFERYVQVIFATDRKAVPKGMIEVVL
jgi:hypothetical protein